MVVFRLQVFVTAVTAFATLNLRNVCAFTPLAPSSQSAAAFYHLHHVDLARSSSGTTALHMSYGMNRRAALTGAGAGILATTNLLWNVNSPAAAAATSTPTSFPEWTLENGVKFPTLAMNTVGLSVEDTERAINLATKQGFTHFDFHPGKERDGMAKYIASNGRNGLFLNTKIRKPKPGTSPSDAANLAQAQIEEDLKALNVDYVDMLMLRDSPDCDVMQAQWVVLENALASGKTRSIGVINYCEGSLKCLLQTAKVKPALNYYLLHVGMGRDAHGLRTFCDENGIKTFAYGAVGEPGPNEDILNNPLLKKIGVAHKKSPEEVALRWVLQSGAAVSVRPTTNFGLGVSVCEEDDGGKCAIGLEKRAGVFGWSLSKKEMTLLDAMNGPDDNPTLFSSSGCPGAFVMPK
uniref:NADP-dependent oxidoreductase domain-containing protein n=2 Tax=Ditylum brightwellii TaxID=49249 RepID=A0A7S4WBA7_9STRA